MTGSAMTGSAMTGSAMTGSAMTGSAMTGSAMTGSAMTGSAERPVSKNRGFVSGMGDSLTPVVFEGLTSGACRRRSSSGRCALRCATS